MKYSIVVPVNNEAENLPVLMSEISTVISKLEGTAETIFIDDGSTDDSFAVMNRLKRKYHGLRIIKLDHCYGQTAALDAGFRQAVGDIIITMDADLQNDPADIPRLLEYYPRYDVITGCRRARQDNLAKRLSSKTANFVRNRLTWENIRDTGCSLKIYKAEYVKRLKLFHGLHRFLPTLCKLEGARVIEVEVAHRPRRFGRTHYGIMNRAFRALKDALAVRWMGQRNLKYRVERIIE